MDSISSETSSILENELSDIQTGSLTLENADMFNKVATDLNISVTELYDAVFQKLTLRLQEEKGQTNLTHVTLPMTSVLN